MALIKPEQLRSGSYNITGSLFGTASYATQALTASYTLNETPTFPFSGSAVITGSLVISGSGLTVTGSISTSGSNGTINGLFVSLGGGNVPSNISIGATTNFSSSATGTDNFAAGNIALCRNTTGTNNTAIGSNTLRANTTGCRNTAIGQYALCANSTGNNNLSLGQETLRANTTGCYNTAIGLTALRANTTGNNNTALGNNVLNKNTTGCYNTAIGRAALACNTVGSNNIAFGQSAGCLFSGSSSNNIAIGFNAGPSILTDESSKLYIASGSGTPLIKGDFAAKTVNISGSLTATSLTGSLLGTASNAVTASYVLQAVSSSFASTASYLNTLNQDLTFNGNLTLNGTASITYLNVSYESASVIYSSGSNQFGDAANDTQTLYGSVIIPTGSVGIGTTTPNTLLNVHGADPFVRINNTSANNQGIKISYNNSDTHGLHLLYNANSALSYIDNTYPVSSGFAFGDIYFRQNVTGTMTTRMTIKGDGGNVGIGTTTPEYKLDVIGNARIGYNSNASQAASLQITAGGQNYDAYIDFAYFDTYDAGIWYVGRKGATGAFAISNYSSNSETNVLTIATTNNVGIGTTTPTSKLDVSGSARITDGLTITGSLIAPSITGSLLGTATTASYVLQAVSSSFATTASFVLNAVSSSYALTASNAQTASYLNTLNQDLTFNGNLTLNGTASISYLNVSYESASVIYSSGSNQFGDAANDTQTLYGNVIVPTGSVGIGTNSPQSILDVITPEFGYASFAKQMTTGVYTGIHFGYRESNNLYRKSAIVFERTDLTEVNAQGKVHILNGPQSGAGSATLSDAKLTINEAGNVGIGTTTPLKLLTTSNTDSTTGLSNARTSVIRVNNTSTTLGTFSGIAFGRNNADTQTTAMIGEVLQDVSSTWASDMVFGVKASVTATDVTEYMRIKYGGNVGIGTTTPNAKLDISGSVNISGSGVQVPLQVSSGNTSLLFVSGSGNVGIGTTSPAYKLDVNGNTNITGTLTATVKSFIIDHPTKEGKKLQYGVLEGPEHSVYVRGKLTNNNTITLPDHWTGLVHEDTITVNLTPIGRKQDLWVETVSDNTITVGSDNKINCFFTVFAERKDIEKLVTEFDK